MMLPLIALAATTATAPSAAAPWMSASLPVNQRVELLLKQMTNAEKQAQAIHLTVSPAPSQGSPGRPAPLPLPGTHAQFQTDQCRTIE